MTYMMLYSWYRILWLPWDLVTLSDKSYYTCTIVPLSYNHLWKDKRERETLTNHIIQSVIPPVSQSAFDCGGVQFVAPPRVCECLVLAALCLWHRLETCELFKDLVKVTLNSGKTVWLVTLAGFPCDFKVLHSGWEFERIRGGGGEEWEVQLATVYYSESHLPLTKWQPTCGCMTKLLLKATRFTSVIILQCDCWMRLFTKGASIYRVIHS